MTRTIIEFISLFLAGLLAGEEFVVRYGVRGPLAALDDLAHIRLRQELIRTLRVLVPGIFVPAFGTGIAAAAMGGADTGYRWVAVAVMTVWLLVTMFGTVPINEAAYEWNAEQPPAGWKAIVDRWERLNTVRTWAAVCAFAFLLTAAALQQQG